jgi:hypothetical protein
MTAPVCVRICMIFPYAIAKKMYVPPEAFKPAGAAAVTLKPVLSVST